MRDIHRGELRMELDTPGLALVGFPRGILYSIWNVPLANHSFSVRSTSRSG